MKTSFPPRIDLARLPTPTQPLRRLGQELGVELYVKRDDLTGAALSGNKIRKLEFVMADALSQNADTVITCGRGHGGAAGGCQIHRLHGIRRRAGHHPRLRQRRARRQPLQRCGLRQPIRPLTRTGQKLL
ncbi:MAG: pyridoxal-phosphate dependent enzyme [Desulfobacterales bacterium]